MALDYGINRYQLAGIKECLYHPSLPTLRRMDMDTIAHKLPYEHCRTTTPCTRENFINNSVATGLRTYRPFKQARLGRNWHYRHYYSFRGDDEKGDKDSETNTIASVEKPVLEASDNKTYPLSSLGTDTNRWKFTLQQEPYIDHFGQRPIPATIFSRYRTNSSLHGGQMSTRAWIP